jgi:hypothetical protein
VPLFKESGNIQNAHFMKMFINSTLLTGHILVRNDNGGKQADVADTTEKFCTKMCVFSACSALKLSTNVIE